MELVQSRTPPTTASHAEGSDGHQIMNNGSEQRYVSLNREWISVPKRQVKNTLNHGNADGE
jgi:hypothetical protein